MFSWCPKGLKWGRNFNRMIVGWNGSHETARALGEALPYLERAESVFVVVVIEGPEAEAEMRRAAVQRRSLR